MPGELLCRAHAIFAFSAPNWQKVCLCAKAFQWQNGKCALA